MISRVFWIVPVLLAVTAWADTEGSSEAGAQALERIAAQEGRIPALREQLTAAEKECIPVRYPQADLTIAERFCQYCRDDVANGRPERALEVAQEVEGLLDRAAAEMPDGVAVPVLEVGSTQIEDGSFWGQCRFEGKEEQRPVFLTGYGHFGHVVEDIPMLARIGINVIQIEQGPRGVVLEDGGVSTEPIENWVLKALDRARDHGVLVCLLISPHYFPGWAFAKWPELRLETTFLKNTVEAPQAREIYERYLRTLLPLIKGHPALHSICLSNEPVYEDAANDPWRLPLWRAYLERTHGTIEALNAAYGTAYGDFKAVPYPKLGFQEDLPLLYDAVRFNQERFAEFHAWMVGIIHEMAPELPCHAKVMPLVWGRDTVFWGTDPWDFAELSQINGNDCYFLPNTPKEPWQSYWQIQNRYYDIQRGMKRVPIFNTENHIIPDRCAQYVAPGHIYTALWQGAIHGQGASTTWAWARTYDAKSDFEGLILHRAACTAAMSRVALDLMRLSREVSALQNVPPRVAILYSNAALVHDSRSFGDPNRLYEALNFCGLPIAFVTDEQAAAGWLERYDALLVTGARNASRNAIEAARAYAGAGHPILAYGKNNLRADQYGRDVAPPPIAKQLSAAKKGEALRDALLEALQGVAIQPECVLKTPAGTLPYGVEWRSVQHDGAALLNLVNLTREPIEIALPEGIWADLITRKTLQSPLTLQTNTPVLAKRRGEP